MNGNSILLKNYKAPTPALSIYTCYSKQFYYIANNLCFGIKTTDFLIILLDYKPPSGNVKFLRIVWIITNNASVYYRA